ncbi:MAG: hypothetical protein IPN72_08755 [Saprospiraceae bacterium]|nr:hypothetical protein [Saprospiraceae bacterium]
MFRDVEYGVLRKTCNDASVARPARWRARSVKQTGMGRVHVNYIWIGLTIQTTVQSVCIVRTHYPQTFVRQTPFHKDRFGVHTANSEERYLDAQIVFKLSSRSSQKQESMT